ncbi:MAG: putative DNA-binding protein [Clostridia bacterium]|nr:putative DNA-binding protein [Clostridia bacterium]
MEKKVEISMLCDIYGKLLTQKQYEFINDYYNNDLSLTEIAENNSITRQAVRDLIKKGERKLFDYEEKLEFMKKTITQEQKIQEVLSELSKIQKNSTDKQIENILNSIRKELSYIV